ncbi:hypothetical protein [Ilumatobacter sp.]|uniref:hypothetical protein n=1 Tax=Ilumatobacter sp. TaxID=1967498 RepID=UPI0037539A35
MSKFIRGLALCVGALCIVLGVSMVYLPAGLITLGVVLVLAVYVSLYLTAKIGSANEVS